MTFRISIAVYFPEEQDENAFPVLLVRTPYDKTFLSFASITYTQQGIAVVTQDLRGRSKSEGVDMIFTTDGDGDLKDGYDTFQWIDDQSWSNDKVVSWGASALGMVQYVS
ncbi:MAG: CocE/NonD family hydrolase, partial [Deltaproteobacteria bacterium]|nr:CocE/NonD family hydrolase [Deltaproteobacteria bacterium]